DDRLTRRLGARHGVRAAFPTSRPGTTRGPPLERLTSKWPTCHRCDMPCREDKREGHEGVNRDPCERRERDGPQRPSPSCLWQPASAKQEPPDKEHDREHGCPDHLEAEVVRHLRRRPTCVLLAKSK